MSADVAVIVLTFNEEKNIAQALKSVCGWAGEVYVVDSFSNDATVHIAASLGASVVQHRFGDYALQRNWALDNLPLRAEWVLFLDADESLPEALKAEISDIIATDPAQNGFYVKWRLIWMGRWIRRGYYPTWLLRLFRRGRGRCESRQVNEHILVEPPTGRLRHDFVHEDRKGIRCWLEKHIRYAEREAEILCNGADGQIEASLCNSQAGRKRWVRYHVYNHLPPLLRPFLYFFYRYVLRGGFLEGSAGLIYHFLHALWLPLIIDAIYLEMRRSGSVRRARASAQKPTS